MLKKLPYAKSLVGPVILCFVLTINFSCKRYDAELDVLPATKAKELFFNLGSVTEAEVVKLANYLKKDQRFIHQLPQFIQKNGIPVWNKTFNSFNPTAYNSDRLAGGRLADVSGTPTSIQSNTGVFFIPLKKGNSATINGYVVAKKHSEDNYSYQMYTLEGLAKIEATTKEKKEDLRTVYSVIGYFEQAINNKDAITTAEGGKISQVKMSFASSSSGRFLSHIASKPSGGDKLATVTSSDCTQRQFLFLSYQHTDISGETYIWTDTYEVFIDCQGNAHYAWRGSNFYYAGNNGTTSSTINDGTGAGGGGNGGSANPWGPYGGGATGGDGSGNWYVNGNGDPGTIPFDNTCMCPGIPPTDLAVWFPEPLPAEYYLDPNTVFPSDNAGEMYYEPEWETYEESYMSAMAAFGGEIPTDPIPESYYNNGVKVDMSAAPIKGSTLTALGHPRNKQYFWEQVLKQRPEMFDQDNRDRILKRNGKSGAPQINDQWIKYNPSHKAYKWGFLDHHHINQGKYAAAIPRYVHQKWTSILHQYRTGGKYPTLRNKLGSFGNILSICQALLDVFTGTPESWINQLKPIDELNKIYYNQEKDVYFEVTKKRITRNSQGEVIKTEVWYTMYEEAVYIAEENKYYGFIKVGTQYESFDHVTKTLSDQLTEVEGE